MKRIFYFLIILIACAACEKDDSFSVSTGMKLDFSVDTLSLDTVFSRTPSSTYSFWVHNRNNDGLRIQNVKLKKGNQTGYRVNVDGIYLDNTNGSQANDIEVRKNDSILVFVELTAADSRQNNPVLLEDDIVFSLESGTEQNVKLLAWAWDALKFYSPVIENDSVLESDKPVVIFGDLVVCEGVTLTVKNTELYFHDSSGMEIFGTLKMENCLMRGDRLDRMFDYLPYDRVSGQWNGIHFHASSTGNELLHSEIRNPQYGIICDSAALDTTQYRLRMQQCIVHNCSGVGIEAVNSSIKLENCQLTNTLGSCLSVAGGITDISYCTLAQFYPFSAERGAALYFTNHQSPLYRLKCEGSIVTGYADDVIDGQKGGSDNDFNYYFDNCLLRTVADGVDSLRCKNIRWETPNDSVQGKMHFVKIDEDNLYYDFHLDSISTAQGLGCYR